MSEYLVSRPDYYERKYNEQSYFQMIKKLSAKTNYQHISLSGGGLELIGPIQAVWERIKGFFGFENAIKTETVEGEWLKFLHYGLKKGFLKEETTDTVKKVNELILKDPVFKKAVESSLCWEGSEKEKVLQFQQNLVTFFRKNEKQLEPSFWNKNKAVKVSAYYWTGSEFGDSYLSLIQQSHGSVRDRYIKKATSRHFSMSDRYSKSLQYTVLPIIEGNKEKYRQVYLRMAKREWEGGRKNLVFKLLSDLDKLDPYFSYMKFICSEHPESEKILTKLPLFDSSCEELRTPFVEKLIDLGDIALEESKSKWNTLWKVLSLGIINRELGKLGAAWNFYGKALLHATGEQFKKLKSKIEDVAETKWNNFSEKLLIIAEEYFDKKDWESSAQFYGIYLKGFTAKELTSSPELMKERIRFALCIASIYQNGNPNRNHLMLLDAVIEAHKVFEENNIKNYINEDGKTFIQDQESNLHFLKGLILERLKYPKTEILSAYRMAVKLAPNHPWGAWGYFAEDEHEGSDIDQEIKNYKKLAIEWGAVRDLHL